MGVEYTGTVSYCDICALSRSRKQAHRKKSTRTTIRGKKMERDLGNVFIGTLMTTESEK